MARLQRKKTAIAKKKKRAPGEEGLAETQSNDVVKAKTTLEAVAGDLRKTAGTIAKKSGTASAASSAPKNNWWTKSGQFLREVKVELKKVTWPSRKQTLGSTAVVLILVLIISVFLGVVDLGLSKLVQWILLPTAP